MTAPRKPIREAVTGLRQRYRKRTGDWRVWWEPTAAQIAAGMKAVELDAERPAWSVQQAKHLNLQAMQQSQSTRNPRKPSTHSIDWLCEAYMKSPAYLSKAEKTRGEYLKDINRILQRWQGTDVRNLTKPVVYTWYEALFAAHGVYVSRRLIKMLSILLSYAELRGRIPGNPIVRMRMQTPRGRRRIATWEEFAALERAAREEGQPNLALAIGLAMFMGQRATDIINARARDFVLIERQMPDQAEPQERLHWRLVRSKDTRLERLSHLIVHDEVLEAVKAAIAAAPMPTSRIILRDSDGKPHNENTFPHAFAALREAAARHCPSVFDLQFRDLRRTFSNNSRHANVASDDVDDALGNTSGTDASLRQVYMPASDARAAEAISAICRPQSPRGKAGNE